MSCPRSGVWVSMTIPLDSGAWDVRNEGDHGNVPTQYQRESLISSQYLFFGTLSQVNYRWP